MTGAAVGLLVVALVAVAVALWSQRRSAAALRRQLDAAAIELQ